MAFNGSGTFNRLYNWVVDRDAGTKILASKMDDEMDGMATGLSTAICRDGQSTITGNIPFNSNKITGLAAGTAATDAARVDQIQKNTVGWVAAGGTVDVITAAYSPTLTAVAAGSLLGVRASGANTSTTPTFNPDGLGAETITKNGGQALVAGDIFGAGHELLLRKRTTGYELLNPGVTITAFARTLLDDAAAANVRTTLGVGAEQDAAWTAAQSITLAAAGNNLSLTTTDAGATGAVERLYHNTASPANSDVPGRILFDGKDSGAADQTWARIQSTIIDVTAASENATLELATVEAGTLATRLSVGGAGGGLVAGAATGGDQGAGTVNATQFYDDGVALPTGMAAAADMEAASSAILAVPPSLQHRHPGHPKAWLNWNFTAILLDYGVTSVSDDGAGLWTPTFDTAFSAANNYMMTHGHMSAAGNATGQYAKLISKTTTTAAHRFNTNGAAADVDEAHTAYHGDQ